VLSQHKGPAFRTTYLDAVADAAWQAITTYSQRYHDELRNIIYHLLPQRKRNQFKVSGVKSDVPRMLIVHHQDVFVEMSTRLQTAQQEIQKLRDQLRDLTAPQQDKSEPSSTQQRHETTVLDEPEAYSPRLDVRKPCRGKGTSGLLTTRLVKVGKVISKGREDNDNGAPKGSRVPAWMMEG
jgi:hypothetical protein